MKSPKIGKYGGRVAAPIFKNIAERIVDSDKNIMPLEKNEKTIDDAKYAKNEEKNREMFTTSNLPDQNAVSNNERRSISSTNGTSMPNLYNLTKRDAIKAMNDLGVKYKIIGSGNVIWQKMFGGNSRD